MTLKRIEDFEKDFEESYNQDNFKTVNDERKKELSSTIESTKKTSKSITLRVNKYALEKFKKRSEENGWNYQSVISAFIVQYGSGKVKLD
ncbi:hypothetical protein [Francisella tularensis]|uniref:hypothetical protein n=1 Tax=Francisella tularensis TaxID=263 RepID=UPI0008F4D934|nr:hypothetical protein [Francisella tularensis]APA83243.1 hypothetical protein N894_1259 [Francisella tularensis subsp. novicida PA10-7858]